MRMFLSLILVFLCFSANAKNDVIFEGYYRLLASNKQVGYVILRYSFNPKKKQFITKSYIRGNSLVGNLQESLVATSDNQFKPVSYHYTSKVNNQMKSLDATFKKSNSGFDMTLSSFDGKTKSTSTQKIDKGVFLSSFQMLVMLQNGLTVGKKYSFKAISEEDGQVHSGEALIKEQPGFEGKGILRILNSFKKSRYISNVTKDGEILITESPLQKIQTQLVAEASEATSGFKFDVSSIKIIFNDIPRGQKNVLAKKRLANQPKRVAEDLPQKPQPKAK